MAAIGASTVPMPVLPASTTWRARTMACGVAMRLRTPAGSIESAGVSCADARAMPFRVGREAERIIERMDMKGLRVMQPLEVVRTAQHLAHLIRRPGLHVGAEIDAQHRGMLDQGGFIVDAAHREAAVARPHVRHVGHRPAHIVDARLGQRPKFLRAWQADPVDDRVDAFGKARRHEVRHCAPMRRPPRAALPAPRPTSRAARARARPSARRARRRRRRRRRRDFH